MSYALRMNNAILLIQPYQHNNTWVFDDERFGLSQEPFVFGAELAIGVLARLKLGAVQKFNLLFSANPLPECEVFDLESREPRRETGVLYRWAKQNLTFWLCPAFYHYFQNPPPKIYVTATAAADVSCA